jgi:tetratricopeptide (TPR) repeat protein
VVLTYVRLLVLPVNQMVDYDHPVARALWNWPTLASAACLLAILGVALSRVRTDRLVAVGCLWFFLTLADESSFIRIADVIFEHRLYLPMFGFVLVVIGFAIRWPLRRAATALAIATVVLGIVAHQRNLAWQDGLALWSDDVRKAPNNPRANTNVGSEYVTRNDPDRARPYLERAVAINPDYGEGQTNLGSFYTERGQIDLAEPHLTRAVALVPDNTTARYNLGTFYLKTGRTDLAEKEFNKALEIDPESGDAYTNLGILMYQTGDNDKAISYSERAVALDARDARAYTNMGRAWKRNGDLQRAMSCYERAYQIDPGAVDNLINLGNAALAMNQLPVAEGWYQRALAADRRSASGLNGMGLVSYYRRDYTAAIKCLEDARASDPSLRDTYNNLALCYSAVGREKDAADIREAGARLGR